MGKSLYINAYVPILYFLHSTFCCFGQDTIKLEPSIIYPADIFFSRAFASSVQHAREDIVFSDTHKRIEYCYYIGAKRNCSGQTYMLEGDSILKIDDQTWFYRKLPTQNYEVYRYFRGTFESGTVTSLIPFTPTGIFTTYTKDKSIVLWTVNYDKWKRQNSLTDFDYIFQQTEIPHKVYEAKQVDTPPVFADGTPLDTFELSLDATCMRYNEPYITFYAIRFIVTATGQIINIEQSHGMTDVSISCYMADVIRQVLFLGPVKPATRNGKNVAVKWIVRTKI